MNRVTPDPVAAQAKQASKDLLVHLDSRDGKVLRVVLDSLEPSVSLVGLELMDNLVSLETLDHLDPAAWLDSRGREDNRASADRVEIKVPQDRRAAPADQDLRAGAELQATKDSLVILDLVDSRDLQEDPASRVSVHLPLLLLLLLF